MKLTSLEIYGFKSFADKTKFVFDQGITGIVGPNGCGKSNVIDSIRWVLGEQKMRNLRSEKMENIIFNGTDKRKKSNFVEVAITFENTKNLLPTAFTTVTVTRRLYRDGDSEYLLNNVPCRLKDINSLFLDTGIGSDSYAIIELGMIDSILNDKNNSRRLLFEEAAGVSRYKIRKKETFLRLEETDKSLERLDDVIFEVEKNLKSYEKQAKRAEQYFELKAEYRLYSIRFAYLKTQDILQVIAQLQTEVEDLNQKMIFADTRIAKHDARVAELQLDATNFEKLLSDKQKILNTHIDTIRKIENEKALRHERIKNLHSRKSTFEKQIITGKERITELQQQMERLEPQIDEANENYDKIEFYLTELEQEQEELKKAVQNRKLQVDEASQQLRSKENTLNHLTRENDRRNTLLGSLDSEKERIRKDLHQRQAEADNFAQTIEKISQEIILLEQECKSIQADKDLVELQVATLTEEATATNEQIFKTRGQLDAKKHEYNLLKDLVENLEGYPESVKFLKQKLKWTKKTSLISDIFYCGQDYKVAIENYLEPYMNYYVVDTQEEALEAIGLLQAAGKGRANFFVLQELNQAYPEKQLYVNSQNTNIVPALDIVEYDAYYTPLANYLFASVYIVEGHDAKVPESATAWVHKNGAVIARKFMLSGGSLGLFEGKRIGRARNLEILQNEITTLETQLKQEQSTLLKLKDELESLKKQKNNRALEDALQRLKKKR